MAKILLVDDSKMSRKMLRTILEGMGHEIVGEAADGVEGLNLYKELHPDIITMDITMPQKDGIACLKERSSPLFFTACSKHAFCGQRYAPRPFFFPVVSMTNSSSSVLRIRISSFFGFISPQPTHLRIGTFFFTAKQFTPSDLTLRLSQRIQSHLLRLHQLHLPEHHRTLLPLLRLYSLLLRPYPSAPCSSPEDLHTQLPVSHS